MTSTQAKMIIAEETTNKIDDIVPVQSPPHGG